MIEKSGAQKMAEAFGKVKEKSSFVIGDKVKVVKGRDKNLSGTVAEVFGDVVEVIVPERAPKGLNTRATYKEGELEKQGEETSTETAQDDPDRICGNIWFNGTEAQRAGFGDGTEGRGRDGKPPKKWWDACIANISKSTATKEGAAKHSTYNYPRKYFKTEEDYKIALERDENLMDIEDENLSPEGIKEKKNIIDEFEHTGAKGETSAMGAPKNCIRRLATGDYVLYDQVGRDIYKSDDKAEVKDAAIRMGIDVKDETNEYSSSQEEAAKDRLACIECDYVGNKSEFDKAGGVCPKCGSGHAVKATAETAVMVPVSTDLTPEETKDTEEELNKAGIKFEKRNGVLFVDDADRDKAADVALGLFIGSEKAAVADNPKVGQKVEIVNSSLTPLQDEGDVGKKGVIEAINRDTEGYLFSVKLEEGDTMQVRWGNLKVIG